MAIFRGPGGSGDATTDSTTQALAATQAAADALVSKNAAAASATSASNSATSATASATSASSSATSATSSATTATNQANIAEVHKDAASIFATNAAISAVNAASSASSASTSATNASNSATTAASYTPSQTGNAGKLLTTDGTNTSWKAVTGSASVVLSTGALLTTPVLTGETYSTSASVTAGTNAQGQGAIFSDFHVVTTTATNPSGVTLPTVSLAGRRIIIVNKGTNPVNVYPGTGAAIDALATNSPISIPIDGWMEFNASSSTRWYSTANVSLVTPTLGTPASGNLANCTFPTLNQNTTGSAATLSSALPISNISATGTPSSTTYLRGDSTWSTIPAGMVYPGAGIPNSTGSAWGTSYGVTGTGSVVLDNSPVFSTDIIVNSATVGLGAGSDIGTRQSNIAFGQDALLNNTSGLNNVALGGYALRSNTIGSNNLGIGGQALFANTDGTDNVGIGTNTLSSNIHGINNTGVGSGALLNCRGNNNIGIGAYSNSVTSGTGNIGIGVNALLSATNISNTIAIGDNVLLTAIQGTNSIYIGAGSDTDPDKTGGDAPIEQIVIGSGMLGKGNYTTTIGTNNTTNTYIKGALNIDGALQLTGSNTTNQNIATNQTTGSLNIGGVGAASGTITIGRGTTAGAQTVQIGGTGTIVTIGAASGIQPITIGRSGTSLAVVNINTGAAGGKTTNIATNTSSGTNTVNIGSLTSGGTNVINLATGSGTQTVNIANGLGTLSNKTIDIGSNGLNTDVSIASGSVTSAISIGGQSSNINIGLGSGLNDITIGSSTGYGTTFINGLFKQQTFTVATLPTYAVGVGARCFVTDALTPVFGSIVVGGGAVAVPVYHDGTNWRVG